MSKVKKFKADLAMLFDDNMHTKVWHNILDWIIIGLILISSIEVFLSTFSGISERYGSVLKFIDVFTTIVFTVEVSLRIWAADEVNPKYKGVIGRIRYCLSFYGLIDILSTYPAFFGLIFNIPVSILKVFRVIRLIRIFRYMKSFRILGKAIASKRQELGISIAFLGIITVILSFLLYYAEHNAQPELCENAWSTLIWAFAKYLGDPGKIADFPLVTVWGNIIAAVVGILGIAIFAVPAGLVGSGFVEVIEETRAQEKVDSDIDRLKHSFRWVKDMQYTNLFVIPPFLRMENLLVKQFLQSSEVIAAVQSSPEFHLFNLGDAYNEEDDKDDRIVVVECPHNRSYGCCIDRHSKITIVSTSGPQEPITSWVAYHVAKLGGFNYVSKEIEMDIDSPVSFYTVPDPHVNEHFELFFNDISELSSSSDSWVIPMCFCTGPQSRKQKVHLCYNKKHQTDFEGPLCTVSDSVSFESFAAGLVELMGERFGLQVDMNEYYGVGKDNLMLHLSCKNSFALRIECSAIYFTADRMGKIKAISDCINIHLGTGNVPKLPEDMKTRPQNCFGYVGYVD